MLILVAVTVNLANKKGGLFEKTREAKSDTAYRAEEETLLTYIYGDGVYDATTGKVNLIKLKELLEVDSNKWKTITLDNATDPTTLTVTGVQSGTNHTINSKGNVNEQKDGEEQPSTGIAGTYYEVLDVYEYVMLKEDFTISAFTLHSDGTVDESNMTYSYNAETKKGVITAGSNKIDFDYVTVKNKDGKEINSGIVLHGNSLEGNCMMKNGTDGIIPLNGNTYVYDDYSLEFITRIYDGKSYGSCITKKGSVMYNSGSNLYYCLNGRIVTATGGIFNKDCEITINSDYSEITVTENGSSTIYKKQ